MCNVKCCGGCCTSMKIGKWLLVVGGLNWGLVGVGMLLGKEDAWNVVRMLLGNWPEVEAIVYVLVGVAAVMKVVGCRCKKCVSGVCEPDVKVEGKM